MGVANHRKEFEHAAKSMRVAQAAYFKSRTRERLAAAKLAESLIDRLLVDLQRRPVGGLSELAELVQRTRTAQITYFAYRYHHNLMAAQQLEQLTTPQGTLF